MATLSDINTKISNLTSADSTQYANSDRLIDINMWYSKIAGIIYDSMDEDSFDDQRNTDYPIQTTPLTTNRDYSLPVSALKIKSLSISYDGVNYHRATPIDITQYDDIGNAPSSATTQNTTIDANFSRNNPCYATKFNAIWIYPEATSSDVAAGASMISEWLREVTPFTISEFNTGAVIPGFDSTFHMMLAYGSAFEFCSSKDMPQAEKYKEILDEYEIRLRRQYSSKQLDRQYGLSSDYQSMK